MSTASNLREKMSRTPEDGGYTMPDEYRADLAVLHESLVAAGARRTAEEWVRPLVRLSSIFGFHLAALDISQNSASYDEAAAEQTAIAGGQVELTFCGVVDGVQVDGVVVVDEVGQVVDTNPWNGLARFGALPHRLNLLAVGSHLVVAVHADFR